MCSPKCGQSVLAASLWFPGVVWVNVCVTWLLGELVGVKYPSSGSEKLSKV